MRAASRIGIALASLVAAVALAACGGTATGTITAKQTATLARWSPVVHLRRPLDVAVRSDGSTVVAADGRLFLLGASNQLTRFAPAYSSPGGEEPYIAAPGAAHACGFGQDSVYAIRLQHGRGITRISANGAVTRFANITAPGLIDGIAFDQTGAFGYRLVATVNHGSTTTVDVIDCRGKVTTITQSAPRVEGGIAVAPVTFGRFEGDLIAPDETGGRIFAITPEGHSSLVAASGLPHGGDIGVESEAFVPGNRNLRALLADRFTPGNRHLGDDVLLSVGYAQLSAAGVRPSDLLVATEGGALTDDVRCSVSSCSVHLVAKGPAQAHSEGHVAFAAQ